MACLVRSATGANGCLASVGELNCAAKSDARCADALARSLTLLASTATS